MTPFGATDTSISYAFSVPSMTSTIPPQISGMTSVTKLYECGSTVSVKLAAGRSASIHSCLTLFSFIHPSMFATLLFIHSFSAVGPTFLYRCLSEQRVDVCTGRLATCRYLHYLTSLTGTIPPQIGGLTSLSYLYDCGSCAVHLHIHISIHHDPFGQLSMHPFIFPCTYAFIHSLDRLFRSRWC